MRYLLAVLLLLVAVPARADAPTTLTLTPLDFGNVVVGETANGTVVATNPTAVPVTVASVESVGAVVESTTCSAGLILQPGEQCRAVLSWRPTAAGALDGSITLQTDAGPVQASVLGIAVPKLVISVKAHGKSLRVRKPVSLISSITSNGQVRSAKAWCSYLGTRLPKKFAKKACGLTTSGSGTGFTAKAEPMCTKDVTLEAKVSAVEGAQEATWRRTWRVFVQPHAGFRASEPICATMGERFG